MSQASIILRSAVGVLNEGGWTRGRYGLRSREGHHCAVGAIRVACWEKADGNESKYMRLQREVTRLLAKCIDPTAPLVPGRAEGRVLERHARQVRQSGDREDD